MTHTNLRILPLLLATLGSAALIGCNPWDDMPDQSEYELDAETWDDNLVAASDGLYVMLPFAGQLLRVKTNGDYEAVDLGGASPLKSYATPDASKVLTFSEWPICLDEDPDITTVADCPEDKLEWGSELNLLEEGKVAATAEVPTYFNRMVFSPVEDGSAVAPLAVAYLDYTGEDIEVNGVLNLGEVLFINLATGVIQPVPIGYSPNRVLFSDDGTRTVVLSRNQATVLDSETFERIVSYDLSADVDQDIDPTDAIITPDGRNLLISVANQQELYSLDMEVEAINIISVSSAPTAMASDAYSERAVIVYQWSNAVDILIRQPNYYNDFEVDTVVLDEACSSIAETDAGFAVLYNTTSGSHDVYRLDLETTEYTEYRVANPLTSLELTPDKAFAVGIGQPEPYTGASGIDAYYDNNWTLSIMNLANDDVIDLVLEAAPVGISFAGGDGQPVYALLLLSDQEYLLQVNIVGGTAQKIGLPEPPTGIGAMADEKYDFYITHESPLGLVSFLDSEDPEKLVQVNGFAIAGIMGEDELPRTGAE